MDIREKLAILADSAKYDASCATSGSTRLNSEKGMGNTLAAGVCHSWASDGRCVSLLKVLLTNMCIYDCVYCINRAGNDQRRSAFTVDELVDLTLNFYQRNYIEGLFLSSGIIRSPDFTMSKLIQVAKKLRKEENFQGYIHLKTIPGAAPELIAQAGLLADRLSVNIELPSQASLRQLAPQKTKQGILSSMGHIHQGIQENREDKQKFPHTPAFAPAGQSTQLIVGASPESDYQILHLTEKIYQHLHLRRVYYSAFIPVNQDKRLPELSTPPLKREHRLYQADWLLRFYQFEAREILDPQSPDLDPDLDPKLSWALKHWDFFPVEINCADYRSLLRVPGIGVTSAQRIIKARRAGRLDYHTLQRINAVMKRARYFITCEGRYYGEQNLTPQSVKARILTEEKRDPQLWLFP